MSRSICTIIEEYKSDSVIQQHTLDMDSANTPQLHSKYMEYLSDAREELRGLKGKQKVLKLKKELYYSGKAPSSAYKDEKFDLKVLKSEIPTWVESDKEYMALSDEVERVEEKIEQLIDIIKQICNRNFAIKNIIDFLRFKNGG